jgi:hypothetical protein
MHYALHHHAAGTGIENATETTQKPMGDAADSAIPGAVFPPDLLTAYAVAMGISLFLLVSIFMGDCDFGFAGDRLPQTEELTPNKKRLAGIADAALPPGREETTRRQHSNASSCRWVSLRIVVRKLWFGESIDR